MVDLNPGGFYQREPPSRLGFPFKEPRVLPLTSARGHQRELPARRLTLCCNIVVAARYVCNLAVVFRRVRQILYHGNLVRCVNFNSNHRFLRGIHRCGRRVWTPRSCPLAPKRRVLPRWGTAPKGLRTTALFGYRWWINLTAPQNFSVVLPIRVRRTHLPNRDSTETWSGKLDSNQRSLLSERSENNQTSLLPDKIGWPSRIRTYTASVNSGVSCR